MATNTIVPARAIKSTVPRDTRVLRAINPFVSMILRSPLHTLLSGRLLLLTCTGRKTGKRFTIPVGYTPEGDVLTIFSGFGWWKNLRSSTSVTVRLRGRQRTGRAEVSEDPAPVLDAVERLVATYGPKAAGQRIGLALDISPPPTRDELARAMEGEVLIRIALDP
jgi:deazaflavin-dependent oxidoreductase (nitroreductase family)